MKFLFFICLITVLLSNGCTPLQKAKESSAHGDLMLIIDAGHGGEDGGAVASDGTKESDLNLSVAKKTEAICGLLGYQSIMTREREDINYPKSATTIRAKKVADQKARVELINGTPNAVLLSIHQNVYPHSKPCGAQALFGKVDGSALFAELIQKNIAENVDQENRRNAAKISDDIYLMKKAQCPAVLVECGFMSNPDELKKLKSPEYQTKLAAVFVAAYIQFLSETEDYYG